MRVTNSILRPLSTLISRTLTLDLRIGVWINRGNVSFKDDYIASNPLHIPQTPPLKFTVVFSSYSSRSLIYHPSGNISFTNTRVGLFYYFSMWWGKQMWATSTGNNSVQYDPPTLRRAAPRPGVRQHFPPEASP
jgi:hypothetical protein